jgi:hypothetical protein
MVAAQDDCDIFVYMSENTYYFAECDGANGTLAIIEVINGASFEYLAQGGTCTDGVITAVIIPPTITLQFNGVTALIANNSDISSGQPGIGMGVVDYSYAIDNAYISNWSGGSVSQAPTPTKVLGGSSKFGGSGVE